MKKQNTTLWPTQSRSFSDDLYKLLSYFEYEPAPIAKKWVKEELERKGEKIKDFGFVLNSCITHKLVDVAQGNGISINEKGLTELRKLRQEFLFRRQNRINASLTYATHLLAIIAIANLIAIGIKTLLDIHREWGTTIAVIFMVNFLLIMGVIMVFVVKGMPKDN